MNKDIKHGLTPVLLQEPADKVTTDFATNILDTQGFEGASLMAIIGTITGIDGSNYLELVAQESDTTVDGDFTTVASTELIGAFTKMDASTEDQVIQTVGYIGVKRYIRIKFDYTGSGISASLVAAIGLLGQARTQPASAVDPVTAT